MLKITLPLVSIFLACETGGPKQAQPQGASREHPEATPAESRVESDAGSENEEFTKEQQQGNGGLDTTIVCKGNVCESSGHFWNAEGKVEVPRCSEDAQRESPTCVAWARRYLAGGHGCCAPPGALTGTRICGLRKTGERECRQAGDPAVAIQRPPLARDVTRDPWPNDVVLVPVPKPRTP